MDQRAQENDAAGDESSYRHSDLSFLCLPPSRFSLRCILWPWRSVPSAALILTQATLAQPRSKARGESRATAPVRRGAAVGLEQVAAPCEAAGASSSSADHVDAVQVANAARRIRRHHMRRHHDFVAVDERAGGSIRTAGGMTPLKAALRSSVDRRRRRTCRRRRHAPPRRVIRRSAQNGGRAAGRPRPGRRRTGRVMALLDLPLARAEKKSQRVPPHRRRLEARVHRHRREPRRRQRLLHAGRRQRIDERCRIADQQPAVAGVLARAIRRGVPSRWTAETSDAVGQQSR